MTSLPRSNRSSAGFTLIEAMITVAVIAILAAVALPNYFDYVTRSRIVEAKTNLADMRTRLEQYFLDNRAYPQRVHRFGGRTGASRQHLPAGKPEILQRDLQRADAHRLHGHRHRRRQHGRTSSTRSIRRTRARPPAPARGARPARPAGSARRAGNADVTAPRHARGFTLIELMVALAIVALLLLIGMPSFTTFLRNSEIRSTSESLVNGLRAASAEAANRNQTVTFELAERNGRRLEVLGAGRRRRHEAGPSRATRRRKPARARRSPSRPPASSRSRSTAWAGSTSIPAIPTTTSARSTSTSIVAGEARPLRIIVDDPNPPAAGKPRGLRMCDPDPALAALVPPDPRAC